MPGGRSRDWYERRLNEGASVAELAAEVDRTPRNVRITLHKLGLTLPRARSTAHVKWAKVEREWLAGASARDLAARYGVTVSTVSYRMRNVRRSKPPTRSRYPQLNDPSWLRVQLALGRTLPELAAEVGTDRHVVAVALRRHAISRPDPRLTPLERVAALNDRTERRTAANALRDKLRSEVKEAGRIAAEARRVMVPVTPHP